VAWEQLAVLAGNAIRQRLSAAPDGNRRERIVTVSGRPGERWMVRDLFPRRRANPKRRDPRVSARYRAHCVPVARTDRTCAAAWSREHPPPRPILPDTRPDRGRFRTALVPERRRLSSAGKTSRAGGSGAVTGPNRIGCRHAEFSLLISKGILWLSKLEWPASLRVLPYQGA